jgi:coenzyme F420-reducing hydrogenase alpha subunit
MLKMAKKTSKKIISKKAVKEKRPAKVCPASKKNSIKKGPTSSKITKKFMASKKTKKKAVPNPNKTVKKKISEIIPKKVKKKVKKSLSAANKNIKKKAFDKNSFDCNGKNMSIKIDNITKIEGHAKLSVKVHNGKVEAVHMAADVGLRAFERLLEGRMYNEAAEITERICGICSQSHTIAALSAVENAMGVKVTKQTKTLRHILLLASIMQSHVLHMYFLALPDYLGFGNAIDMASKHMAEVKRALRLKRLSNDIVQAIGGREIHCFTPVIGGFAKIPDPKLMNSLAKAVKAMKEHAMRAAKLFGRLKYPKFERKSQYVSLQLKERFNFIDGSLISDGGLRSKQENFGKYLIENINEYSSAKELWLKNKSFMVGALARVNNNLGILSRNAKKAIKGSKLSFPNYNPFVNNFAQAVEVVHILDCLQELLTGLDLKDEKPVDFKIKKGKGVSIVEVPRGILIHEYEIDSKGRIVKANIIAPTTMNLHNIEDDIKEILPCLIHEHADSLKIVDEFEKLIRAYDPCISCSTHFLELKWL